MLVRSGFEPAGYPARKSDAQPSEPSVVKCHGLILVKGDMGRYVMQRPMSETIKTEDTFFRPLLFSEGCLVLPYSASLIPCHVTSHVAFRAYRSVRALLLIPLDFLELCVR